MIQDLSTRFPAAKIVPSTGGSHVIPAIEDIYVDFGYPDTHRTDNGPPFDSQEFNEFSRSHGIKHRKVFPYHPQANPVETLMKPLGKAMKIANYGRQSKGKALNSFLTSYRSTPHPSTGQAPGDLLFRGGYRNDFPRHTLSESQVKDAKQQDKDLGKDRQDVLNALSHQKASNFLPGDLVIVRNNQQRKFDPLFGPEIFTVIQPVSNRLLLERTRDGQIFRQHCDDVKAVNFRSDNHKESEPPIKNKTMWIWDNGEAAVPQQEVEHNQEVILQEAEPIVQVEGEGQLFLIDMKKQQLWRTRFPKKVAQVSHCVHAATSSPQQDMQTTRLNKVGSGVMSELYQIQE